jgi:hypothetical protein
MWEQICLPPRRFPLLTRKSHLLPPMRQVVLCVVHLANFVNAPDVLAKCPKNLMYAPNILRGGDVIQVFYQGLLHQAW